MTTQLEETVQQEQEEYESQQVEGDNPEDNAEDGALFDKSQYETEALALPKVDGEGIDKIAAKFAGLIWLERGDEADVALIRDKKVGQTVTLMVECEVGPPVPGYTTNREGDLDTLALSRKFTVKHVYRPAGAGLEQEAA